MVPVLYTPLRVERAALRPARRGMRLVRTGMGPRRAASVGRAGPDPVLVAGVGGGVAPAVRPGDVVVANEVRLMSEGGSWRAVEVRSAPLLAGALRRLGLTAHVGPVVSAPRITRTGPGIGADVLAVDMESAALLAHAEPSGAPCAVVRAIVDTAEHPLCRAGTVTRGVRALRTLRTGVPALEQWAAATGPRQVRLAGPRSLRAGVSRAVRAVAAESDVVLVAGSAHSSGSVRLVEVAGREGVPVHLVEDASEVDLRWLSGVERIGVTAGASAPPHLVSELVRCIQGLGPTAVMESELTTEDITFAPPKEVL